MCEANILGQFVLILKRYLISNYKQCNVINIALASVSLFMKWYFISSCFILMKPLHLPKASLMELRTALQTGQTSFQTWGYFVGPYQIVHYHKLFNILIRFIFYLPKCLFQELKPTLDELGIATLEEMGYDKPELALPNPYEIH